MAKKKTNPKQPVQEPLLEKIAGKLGHMTGELIEAKNHLVEIAGGAIDSVKEKIHNITAKKPVPRKAVKVVAKKPVKKVVEKTAPAKKVVKKAVKKATPAEKAVKKVIKKVAKKVAPVKKAIKKVAKKAAAATRGIRRR